MTRPKLILLSVLVVLVVAAVFVLKTSTEPGGTGPEARSSGTLKELLDSPLPNNASAEDRKSFVEKVRSLAQSVDTVSVGPGCALSPAIISIKSGSGLTFKNQDTAEHVLTITEEIRLRPGKESGIKAVFNGPGLYGIVCDGPYAVGYIDLFDQK